MMTSADTPSATSSTSAQRTLLGFGGTFSIESPAPYSAVAKGLIEELGIDVPSYPRYVNRGLYRSFGLGPKVFFDKETFGADKLVINPLPRVGGESEDEQARARDLEIFLQEAPFSAAAKADYRRLATENKDYLPGLSSDEKKARLARMSYNSFLTDLVKVSPEVVKLFQAMPQGLFGVGFDAVAAQDAWGLGAPGFAGMNLDPAPGKGMNRDAIPNEEAEKYFFHFPDGNASIARLLVRKLIPQAIPGHSAADVVMARANYARLDEKSSPVRIRLNSTAVRVRHQGDPASARGVEIAYARRGKVYTVQATHCILACWHVVIPYICEQLPEKAEASALVCRQGPIALHQCRHPELEGIPEAGHQLDLHARRISLVHEPGLTGQHRRLRMLAETGRANRHPHDEDAVQARPSGARAASSGPGGALHHDV